MRTLHYIEGKDIKKESADNNYIYVKLTRYQAFRWLNFKYFITKFNLHSKTRVLELSLPALQDKSLEQKLHKEQVWNEVIDMLINVATIVYSGKLNARKYVSQIEKLKGKEIPAYEDEIMKQDEYINRLESLLQINNINYKGLL